MKSLRYFISSKINAHHDFKCVLECMLNDVDNKISLILKNITGEKKEELIGSNVDSIDMNLLLPDSFRHIHDNFMIDIITKRESSQFWNNFIDGKMMRGVNIINPINKRQHSVKINIKFKSNKNNVSLFDVSFTDIVQIPSKLTKPCIYSHDLNAILKSAINMIDEIENTYNARSIIEQDQILMVRNLLNEAQGLCVESRITELPDNVSIITNSKNVKLYLEIPNIIKKIELTCPHIKFKCMSLSSLVIGHSQYKILLDFILEIINELAKLTNLLEIINIKISEDTLSKIMFIHIARQYECDELSNHNVIEQKQLNAIGLGSSNYNDKFKLVCNEWIKHASIKSFLDTNGIDVGYNLSIKCDYDHDTFTLNTKHVKLLSSIHNEICTEHTRIVLLVDDVLLNLKIICLKIIKLFDSNYKYNNFPVLTNVEWQEHGIIVIGIPNYKFVLGSNGCYGLEIAQMIPCDLIVTDIQMPMLSGYDMIKSLISHGITSKIIVNSAIVDENDGEFAEFAELIKKNQISWVEKGSNFNWIEGLRDILI